MRALWLAGTILALGGLPVAVADATPAPEENPPMCGAPASATAVERGSEIRMVAGFGDNGFAIDTDNPEAQAWFNYGMRLRWAFEHTEAVRAFQKARALDPECGMCAWGQAYAMGANLNYDVS
ncbi:MAG TPA: tetratricopeptide repeat protein, partial [Caulobacteraceae bacterium]